MYVKYLFFIVIPVTGVLLLPDLNFLTDLYWTFYSPRFSSVSMGPFSYQPTSVHLYTVLLILRPLLSYQACIPLQHLVVNTYFYTELLFTTIYIKPVAIPCKAKQK